MFDGKFRTPVDRAVKPIGNVLRKTGLTPDHLTILGLLVGIGAAVAIGAGELRLGLLLVILAALPDLLDGALAKASDSASQRGAFFDSTVSFAMARSGRVTTIILGAFEVAQNGDLANWSTPNGGGGIGGAMDLAAGGARVIALCYHREKNGRSKLVKQLSYPPSALACVQSVVTDLAWIDVDTDGFLLRELAPGLTVDDVKAATAAPLRVASDVREMQFG